MSADLLRRAARVARETADAATDGPWRYHDTHLTVGGHTATVLAGEGNDLRLVAWLPSWSHEPWDQTHNPWRNAMHAALWHPVVARAVADVLEEHAPLHSDIHCYDHDPDEGIDWECPEMRLARALLKEGTTHE